MTTDTPTRRDSVLKFLRSARRGRVVVDGQTIKTPGGWVPGYLFNFPEVGGADGLRRLRELRTDGTNIEMRRVPESAAYEYRLAK
jgi:hypothetical protein